MYVCFCMGLNEKEIQEYIEAGFITLDEITEISSAGKRCGQCKEDIIKILNELRDKELEK